MNVYDRADRIASRVSVAIIVFALLVLAFNFARAYQHRANWEWMVTDGR